MRKYFVLLLSLLITTGAIAGEKDEYFTFNAGFLFNSTLNATFGYERELTYGSAIELTGEVGNKWQRDPVCGKVCSDVFWKGYYWDGGLLYKHCLRKYKNSNLRLRFYHNLEPIQADMSSVWRGDWNTIMSSALVFSFH